MTITEIKNELRKIQEMAASVAHIEIMAKAEYIKNMLDELEVKE